MISSQASVETPIGFINLAAVGDEVASVVISRVRVPDLDSSPVLERAKAQLAAYFAGESQTLDFAVNPDGTEFQRAVWAEIAKLGFGQTATYADIAKAIGRPKAVRAVGGAVGANPVPLVIGCHRVLGANGRITGYSGGEGLPTKRWLLAHEGIPVVE
jgi:methylated-DNA-[protein]-cysteine S-methyltransferase